MKIKFISCALLFFGFLFQSCTSDRVSDESLSSDVSTSEDASRSSDASSGGGGNSGNVQAGLITAGEWNDLEKWNFWKDLENNQEFSKMASYWKFYTDYRVSIQVKNSDLPVVNAVVKLYNQQSLVSEGLTDNMGVSELWVSLFDEIQSQEVKDYHITVNDKKVNQEVLIEKNKVNTVVISVDSPVILTNKVELSFIVDATGSMGDELEFLKDDLEDVIKNVEKDDSSLDVRTSSVFYRDEGDDYLVKISPFTGDLQNTLNFISKQSADGGGDYPEAVEVGLKKSIEDLKWSSNAKTRIAFLLLDAPPHHNNQVIESIQNTVADAQKKGIKIIPITASGVDKETEFLMRYLAISTQGTYVFITNDSGIGNDHIEASVGQYEVEKLNDLIVRLIQKYSK